MLLDQLDSYKLDITAIQEMRWLGKGVTEKMDHVVLCSCQKKSHVFGKGFIVNKKKKKNLSLDFQAKSHRTCRLRIKGKFFNYSLICMHAPTEDKSDEEKDSFYDELDEIYGECTKRDCKIIIGDINAKVGNEDVYRSDGNVFNQIDHILIDVRHCSDLMDVRSYRGANIDSDHYLMISKIRSRISNARKIHGSQAKKMNCGKLVEQGIATRYTGLVTECLVGLSDSEDVSEAWRDLRDVTINAAGAVLGRVERIKYKNWFDGECEQVTNEKTRHIRECSKGTILEGPWKNTVKREEKEKDCIKRRKGNMINKNRHP
ncbi:hypothetical protein B7P43_G09059 [Cryptotermes secundus]|uniref:Endonuclease/exonuclease/phosphatase domain-containing protein n=1 Tax=Cryptotermes secundus TaxID=105785 RepID=A0A2J7PLG3_9NEOP|nr:hypothetical protein B7P43_G09059 [Cryptotermes secundus]